LKSNKLTINAAGLIGGARKMRDGVTFFGKKLKHGDLIVNDFELSIDYTGIGLYTFIIYYKKGNKFLNLKILLINFKRCFLFVNLFNFLFFYI